MVNLTAKTPCEGLLPVVAGSVTLSETDPGRMTALAAYKGQGKRLAAALKSSHGLAAPAANRATGREGCRALWFGREMLLLAGPDPDPVLARHAALSDQSDAWAVVRLDGAGARDVLARLVPVDLRTGVFKRGHTARTDLKHMMASVTRIGENSYQIMVFRGFAETLVHDLKTAMHAVAARGAG